MSYTVQLSTLYPGYRETVVITAKGEREYLFHSDADGSHVRYIQTRKIVRAAASTGSFRRLASGPMVKMYAPLETVIKAHLQTAEA